MRRCFDILVASTGLVVVSPLLVIVAIAGWFDTRSPLFLQTRLGRNKQPFAMVKFRTMHPGTAQVATHLASSSAVTPFGRFLRRTKLDELPQLWNVLKGEMSMVGPRPCLANQTKLISARERLGVFAARPGITGLAQVRGIDMSDPELLAQTDAAMLASLSLRNYCHYLFLTLRGRGAGDRVAAPGRRD